MNYAVWGFIGFIWLAVAANACDAKANSVPVPADEWTQEAQTWSARACFAEATWNTDDCRELLWVITRRARPGPFELLRLGKLPVPDRPTTTENPLARRLTFPAGPTALGRCAPRRTRMATATAATFAATQRMGHRIHGGPANVRSPSQPAFATRFP